MIITSTPNESRPNCCFGICIRAPLGYPSFVPHSGQNLAVAITGCPHLGQLMVPVDGAVSVVPHSGQNLDVAGTLALHLGHITSAAAGAGAGPVGVIICGIKTIPVPSPAPDDLPNDSAASFNASKLDPSRVSRVRRSISLIDAGIP